jgi:CoA:oxalate CoA-transferase
MTEKALDGVKVLDLSWHIAGPYCTKLLADYGAEVIKVERPDGGDPARKAGPFPNGKTDPESSGLFLYLNNNKKSITLNLKTESGKKHLKELAKWADILVENFSPSVLPNLGLDYESLKTVNPELVMTSISNFGQTGPYRDYKATDIVLQAVGGLLLYRGDPTREPVKAAGKLRISEYIGGAYAAAATLSAMAYQRRTGIGQHVDISLMETTAQMIPHAWLSHGFELSIWPPRFTHLPGIEECKDGYIGINILTGQHWVDLCGMMEMYDWAENDDYTTGVNRLKRGSEVRDRMRPWLMARTRKEIQKEATDWRIPVSSISTAEDIAQSEHYQARGYIAEVQHPVIGKVTQPGAPFRMSETPWGIRTPAPLLGQHNKDMIDRLD